MNVNRQVHLLGCGQYRIEPLIVEKQSAKGSHDDGSDECQLVDASAHLVSRRGWVVQRNGGKSSESGRMLRNLLCESNGHLATQLDDLWVAPLPAPKYFADNLDTYDGLYEAKLDAINRTYALSLFPRLARDG